MSVSIRILSIEANLKRKEQVLQIGAFVRKMRVQEIYYVGHNKHRLKIGFQISS